MNLTRKDLDAAAGQGLLQPAQIEPLWRFLAAQATRTASFRASHILYYVGGLIAIGAMTLFITTAWELLGGPGLLVVSLLYLVAAVAATERVRATLRIPAGILGTFAIAIVPLLIYAAQLTTGLWPAEGSPSGGYRDYHRIIDWRWLMMEIGTLLAGAIALWRWRLPFLMMPIAVTLWYMGMDLAPLLADGDGSGLFAMRARVSVVFGLLMLVIAFVVDLRARHGDDYAFWLYLFGVLSFWGGMTAMDSGSEWGRLLYAAINVLMIIVGAALSRRVFAVFGGIGLALYLGHLSHRVFRDSLLFPVALTAIGLLIVGLGIVWQRHEAAIGRTLRGGLPAALRELVEARSQG